MYKQNSITQTKLYSKSETEGERLETKIKRILTNKEPLTDGAPEIFTERKDGVKPGYNIRTDRFEVALDAMDNISRTIQAQRDNVGKVVDMEGKDIGGAEPTQGTDN